MTQAEHETLIRELFPHASGDLVRHAAKAKVIGLLIPRFRDMPDNVINIATWEGKRR